jgi:hypothetical protein
MRIAHWTAGWKDEEQMEVGAHSGAHFQLLVGRKRELNERHERDPDSSKAIADAADSAASSSSPGLTKAEYYESNYRSEFFPSVC